MNLLIQRHYNQISWYLEEDSERNQQIFNWFYRRECP